ncbi:MAG: nickel-dependent hydrogenase large subunit [Desulfobulbaceae bacterium]|nr:nickel-dependent hydrogenase large subunit [Desulfobulbaceae bacterium]
MAGTILPFGPQHPVLPEPLHLNLQIEDEIVVSATPAFGYVHRGLEKLADIRDFRQMIQVVERVCGICSMIHALTYCQGLEELMGIEPTPRARFLRVIWSELHRLHSHLLWLGLFADAMGFESLFMQLWKVRERIMDINEATAGNRVILSVNVIGGVRRDLDSGQTAWILSELAEVEKGFSAMSRTILHDYTVQKRTRGKGALSRSQAMELGCVGPMLRASGVSQDMRLLGYAAYGELEFAPVVEQDGDCYARCRVRFAELGQSIGLIRQAIAKLPAGDTSVPVKGRPPAGEVVARAEQPRGECLYYIKANGGKFLDRLRIRTPTFANIPALTVMLPGIELADVPVVLLSIDPCISCTER